MHVLYLKEVHVCIAETPQEKRINGVSCTYVLLVCCHQGTGGNW